MARCPASPTLPCRPPTHHRNGQPEQPQAHFANAAEFFNSLLSASTARVNPKKLRLSLLTFDLGQLFLDALLIF